MRPKLHLDELNKALLIAAGVCYLLSFVLNRYAGLNTLLRLLFVAALVFLGIRLFAGHPEKRSNENMKFLAAVTAVKDFFRVGSPGARGRSRSPAPNAAISSLPKAETVDIL